MFSQIDANEVIRKAESSRHNSAETIL